MTPPPGLLSRLTQGAATMETTLAAMSAWGRAREGGSPRSGEREALLREWAAQSPRPVPHAVIVGRPAPHHRRRPAR
ncbi:hypothetical protein [Streptomyces sp. NPDC056938]|uniref:hypothetical protein n=1 Tax=unclassified Streptomyces TaxID=2593676 RepID=UPI00363B12B7